jgi:type II secretory pathway pseudopilin PulG
MRPPGRTARPGFGLLEAIVVLMVVMILAAVIAPSTVALDSIKRLDRAERDLARLIEAITAFEIDLHHCPGTLPQLVEPLVAGDRDLLDELYTGGERNRWNGPYYNLLIPASGQPQTALGPVTGLRAIILDPIIPALVIETDIYDAAALDGKVDSGDGPDAGWIQWTVISGDLVELEYRMDVACAPGASA